jgi:hypothetical protein
MRNFNLIGFVSTPPRELLVVIGNCTSWIRYAIGHLMCCGRSSVTPCYDPMRPTEIRNPECRLI